MSLCLSDTDTSTVKSIPSRAADHARCADEALPSTSVTFTAVSHRLSDDLREDVTGQFSRSPKLIHLIGFKVDPCACVRA